MKKILPIALVVAILVGCTTLYQSVITLTSVVDSAMKQWAALSVAGKTSQVLDNKIIQAHDVYRQSAATAQAALVAYKNTGDQGTYVAALNAAKAAAQGLIDLIVPLLTPNSANTLQNNFNNAKAL